MATTKSVFALKTILILLFCLMIPAYIYVIAIGGLTSCFDWTSRWSLAMVMGFYVYDVFLLAWYFYKESSWIKTAIFFVILQALGSVVIIPYIFIQLHKLSPEEIAKDPLYFALARHHKREHTQGASVVALRILFSTIGCLLLGVLIYTLIMDIYVYHGEAFSPCFLTTMIDIYIQVVLFSIWIAYKESSWISASLWILALACFGSITLCVYIVRQLFYLSPEQDSSLIIFKSNDKDLQSSDPLLTPQANVEV